MPVTAKLSQKFYQKLGDDVANELVEWLNSVDANARSDLHGLMENFALRFEARLDQRVAELRQEIGSVRQDLRGEIGALRAELIKWSFVFFATAALAVIGLR